MMVFANIFGSMANEVLPQGIIMIFLMIIIFIGILINIRNAVIKFKEETMRLRSKDFDPDIKELPEIELKEKLISEIKNSKEINKIEINSEELIEVDNIKKYEGRNFHPVKTPIFILTILLTIIYFLLKGSSSIPSILGLPKCHWSQNLILVITVLLIVAIQMFSIKIVMREQVLKLKHNFHQKHEVLFSNTKITFLVAFAIIVGFLANLLGLGGGFVIFPMFVSIGVSPLVASATTIFMIFLSKIVAALLAMFSQYLKGDYTIAAVICVGISVIIFSVIADAILKR